MRVMSSNNTTVPGDKAIRDTLLSVYVKFVSTFSLFDESCSTADFQQHCCHRPPLSHHALLLRLGADFMVY